MGLGRGRVKPLALVAVVVIAAGLIGCWQYLRRPETLPFHHLNITVSSADLPTAMVEHTVRDALQGGFFSADLTQVSLALQQMPWVRTVALRRVWPDTLSVAVTTRVAKARWGNAGLIDTTGQFFAPPYRSTALLAALPQLIGLPSQQTALLQDFDAMTQCLVHDSPIQLAVLRMDPDGHVVATLRSKQVVVLGAQEVASRFCRLASLYTQITQADDAPIESFDCRYANGIAVLRKKTTVPHKNRR